MGPARTTPLRARSAAEPAHDRCASHASSVIGAWTILGLGIFWARRSSTPRTLVLVGIILALGACTQILKREGWKKWLNLVLNLVLDAALMAWVWNLNLHGLLPRILLTCLVAVFAAFSTFVIVVAAIDERKAAGGPVISHKERP